MNEVFSRAMFLEINEYPRDYRDCVRQAVMELVSAEQLRDLYTLYGITLDEYIEDMAKAYLRHRAEKISEAWRKVF